MRMGIAMLALTLALGGCVTAEVTNLDQRTSIISGRGTSFDDPADVARVVLAKAATEAQARGFSHFAVIDMVDRTVTAYYETPTTSETEVETRSDCRGPRCRETTITSTTVTGGDVLPSVEPGSDITIRFLHAEEVREGAQDVWEAASVLAVQPRR